jgi:hypothetical protein
MATTLTNLQETLTLSGVGSYAGANVLGQAAGALNLPGGPWTAMATTLTFGTGSGQVNQVFIAQRTVGAGANDNLDLSGVLTSPIGDSIAFTKVKLLVIAIESPDGTKKLKIGPNNVSNAFQGPFGAVTANVYLEMTNWLTLINEPVVGYTVTPGTADLLVINNPGAGAVTYDIAIFGLG